jgi:uncharacterized protein YbdZ (MbtH family)
MKNTKLNHYQDTILAKSIKNKVCVWLSKKPIPKGWKKISEKEAKVLLGQELSCQ